MERFDVDHVTTEVRHVILFIEFLKYHIAHICTIEFGSRFYSKTTTL